MNCLKVYEAGKYGIAFSRILTLQNRAPERSTILLSPGKFLLLAIDGGEHKKKVSSGLQSLIGFL
jgi:hypothetical protein